MFSKRTHDSQDRGRGVDVYAARDNSLAEQDARHIYGDIVEADLARLTASMNSAMRGLIRSAAQRAVALPGALGIGMFTGLLSSELITAATALGVSQALYQALQQLLAAGSAQDAIRGKDMYFLWKVVQQRGHDV